MKDIKNHTKTVYLKGKDETDKQGDARVSKILRVQKKLGKEATQSTAVRVMIDTYTE
jgi:hypothetical protein